MKWISLLCKVICANRQLATCSYKKFHFSTEFVLSDWQNSWTFSPDRNGILFCLSENILLKRVFISKKDIVESRYKFSENRKSRCSKKKLSLEKIATKKIGDQNIDRRFLIFIISYYFLSSVSSSFTTSVISSTMISAGFLPKKNLITTGRVVIKTIVIIIYSNFDFKSILNSSRNNLSK